MEQALALTPFEAARTGADSLSRFDLLYLGSEFCQNLLPSAGDVVRLEKKSGKRVAVVTPFCNESGLASVEKMAAAVLRERPSLEVVANDMGVIAKLSAKWKQRVKISLGRVLVSGAAGKWFDLNIPSLQFLYANFPVCGVETDSVRCLTPIRAARKINISYHLPLRYLAFTRYCPFARENTGRCGHKCEDRFQLLKNPNLACPHIIARNNAYFMPGEKPPLRNIDRIVLAGGKLSCSIG